MHFEDFWNGAESLGAQFTDDTVENAIDRIKLAIDKLDEVDKLPSEQAEIIGEVVFDLCQITRHLNINSAAALRLAIESRKAQLLDPESPTDVSPPSADSVDSSDHQSSSS